MDSKRFDGLVRSFGQTRSRRQFDGLSRALGTGASRRQVVRGLAGLGLAAASAIGVTAATNAAPTNGPACCAQEQRNCKAECRSLSMKFNKDAFICNPNECGQGGHVDLCFPDDVCTE